MKTSLIATAVTAVFVSGIAAAGSYGEEKTARDIEAQISASTPEFSQLDADGNGALTATEAQQSPELSSNWKEYDKNEDGQLNRAEFSAFEKTNLEERAKQYEKGADEAEDRIDNAN